MFIQSLYILSLSFGTIREDKYIFCALFLIFLSSILFILYILLLIIFYFEFNLCSDTKTCGNWFVFICIFPRLLSFFYIRVFKITQFQVCLFLNNAQLNFTTNRFNFITLSIKLLHLYIYIRICLYLSIQHIIFVLLMSSYLVFCFLLFPSNCLCFLACAL